MTILEACEQALLEMDGRAPLKYIYFRVKKLVKLNGKTPEESIRSEIYHHPERFRKRNDKNGWWELASYQTEIAELNQRIKELEEENEILRAVKTEDDFVRRLVEETKKQYKHDKEKTEVIRQILYNMKMSEAEAELDAWIVGKEYKPSLDVHLELFNNKNTNIETNYGPNVDVHDGGTVSLPDKSIKQ